jgi:hypothetical protein
MQRSTLRRGLVALAAVIGLFAFSATPASASEPSDITGTIFVGDEEEFEVGGPDENPCGATDIDVVFNAGAWTVTGTMKAPFTVTSDPSQTKYQADISFLAGSGGTYAQTAVGPPPEYSVAGLLNVQIVIRLLDKDGPNNIPEGGLGFGDDCAKGPAICTIRTRLIVDSAQSEHVGTLGPPPTGTTTLVASTELAGGIRPVVVTGTCPVTIQGSLVGQAIVAALTLTW